MDEDLIESIEAFKKFDSGDDSEVEVQKVFLKDLNAKSSDIKLSKTKKNHSD